MPTVRRLAAVTPSSPATGLAVAHLFWTAEPGADRAAILAAIDEVASGEDQVVTVSILGHHSDLCTMLLVRDQWTIRRFQTRLAAAGLLLVDSYLSLTELSEYAQGVPEPMKQARLYPQLPPPEKPAFCFYPMSKRRTADANWYRLPFEEREALMREHGASGRAFAGRVVQLITASTGLDDDEWAVTLFCQHPDDVKEVVYTMRFDEASAVYAEFGRFVVGMVAEPGDALASIGLAG